VFKDKRELLLNCGNNEWQTALIESCIDGVVHSLYEKDKNKSNELLLPFFKKTITR